MPVSPIEIKGIHNIAAKDPVNQVAHGATEDKTVSDGFSFMTIFKDQPLPPVPRCSYHMIDHEKSRCYLLARFKLQNGDQRYLLEIDTSDNRKTMSTRIMGFKAGVEAGKCIDRILRETVKGSLRWPGTMAKYCEPLHSVHHPKESSPGANHARVFDWKQRIRAALG